MTRWLKLPTPRWSVRIRVMAAVVSMAALALVLAGGAAYLVEREKVESAERTYLIQSGKILEQIANDGYNSRTGEQFTSLRDVLYNTLQVIPASPAQGMVAFIEGRPELFARPDVAIQLQNDSGFLTQAGQRSSPPAAVITTITGDHSQYRTYIHPIEFLGTQGALVIAYDRTAAFAALNATYRTYALVGGVAMVLIAMIGWVLVGRLLQPIRLLRTTSEEISSSDLSGRIPIIGNDDLASVSETFNTMLDRLEHGFASQRALLDDVSHELRTPLTIVRGHLELMDPVDASDVAQTKDLVIDEIDRMNVLVDDLVTLAKVRQPDFVKTHICDVALLTDEILSKAQALGNRRWVLDSLADVEWELDPYRITQALLQLASNSVKFSDVGTTVGVGSQVRDHQLHLWVRDEGRGIHANDFSRVFTRFSRVDAAIEGSGLGLTIVQSIAQAHFGRVELTSSQEAENHGTTITMVIPPSIASNRKEYVEPDPDRG